MRISTFHSILPHLDKKAIKDFTPQNFIPFEWDKNNEELQQVVKEKKVYSKEDKEKIIKRLESKKATGKVATF
ncbi:hypothetical protein [Carboxylicivirga sp. RSCT41]|uniref:hypothetical protein n=1 Tax=Carboxylicivirga agarovorans TaxID=3417570 RepID=UPI003D329B8B